MISREQIDRLIETVAGSFGLDARLVQVVVEKESGHRYNPYAIRFERKLYEKRLQEAMEGTPSGLSATGQMENATSWGLMQVLGSTARWMAAVYHVRVPMYMSELCDPETGLIWGCRTLKFYLDRNKGDVLKALKGYNGSMAYAWDVMGKWEKLKGE